MSRNSGAPLSFQQFAILASLSEESKHGYAISNQISEVTDGVMTLSAATLYENLNRLLKGGLVQLKGIQQTKPRRKVYAISESGTKALLEEWEILQQVGKLVDSVSGHTSV